MSPIPSPAALDALRRKVRALEVQDRVTRAVLPFGVPPLDARLPGGGLAMGALHEVAGGADEALYGATAARFAIAGMAQAVSSRARNAPSRDMRIRVSPYRGHLPAE